MPRSHHIHITPAPHRERSAVTSRAPPRVRSRAPPPTTSKPAPSLLERSPSTPKCSQPRGRPRGKLHHLAHLPRHLTRSRASTRSIRTHTYLRCGRESTGEITTRARREHDQRAWARSVAPDLDTSDTLTQRGCCDCEVWSWELRVGSNLFIESPHPRRLPSVHPQHLPLIPSPSARPTLVRLGSQRKLIQTKNSFLAPPTFFYESHCVFAIHTHMPPMNNTDIPELSKAQMDEVVFLLGEMSDGTLVRITPPFLVALRWLVKGMYPHEANPPPNGWVTIPKRLLNVKEWKYPKKMIKIHTATMDPNTFIAMWSPLPSPSHTCTNY